MDQFDRELMEAGHQGSDAWIDSRLGRFTASEMYKLMTEPRSKADKEAGKLSEGAMTYVMIKVSEVLTGNRKEDRYSPDKEWGKEIEPIAKDYFTSQTGLVWEPAGFFPFGDHAGCSPDGYLGEDEGLEVKCPSQSENHVNHLLLTDQYDLKRECPDYYWQIMSSLLFTGRKQWHFVSFDPRMQVEKLKMQHIVVKPVSEDLDLLVSKLEKAIKEKLSLIKLLQ